jgi:hypothetical protein
MEKANIGWGSYLDGRRCWHDILAHVAWLLAFWRPNVPLSILNIIFMDPNVTLEGYDITLEEYFDVILLKLNFKGNFVRSSLLYF